LPNSFKTSQTDVRGVQIMGMDFTECENDLKLIIQLDRKKKNREIWSWFTVN